MSGFNKIMLMGNLTRDVELKTLPSGTHVADFAIACNRKFKRQDGEQGEETLFVDCSAFGRTGEVIAQYLSKGSPIFIEGRLKLDQWESPDGGKRSKHTVVVDRFEFLGGGGDAGGGAGRPASREATAGASQGAAPVDKDEIPF